MDGSVSLPRWPDNAIGSPITPSTPRPCCSAPTHASWRSKRSPLNLWRAYPRNPPEVFCELGKLTGRTLPQSEREAHTVLAFYRRHGPLARAAFCAACARTQAALGEGRALSAYLDHLSRQIQAAEDVPTDPSQGDPP